MAIIGESFIKFLAELAANNDRVWFAENKKRYEAELKAPFLGFVEEIRARLMPVEPSLAGVPAAKMIFRIYRDIRFSKDERPYKDHVSALISPTGTKDKTTPAHYLQISAKEVFIAGGIYFFGDKDSLFNVRNYVRNNHKQFLRLISDKNFTEKFGGILGEKNKRLPKEFADFEEVEPLIANKQFYWAATFDPKILLSDDSVDIILDHFAAARDLQKFFQKALA